MTLRVLKTETGAMQERVVALLEGALADAKAGKTVGVFMFTEDLEGGVQHSRDGMSDALVVFWMEITKRRITAEYVP